MPGTKGVVQEPQLHSPPGGPAALVQAVFGAGTANLAGLLEMLSSQEGRLMLGRRGEKFRRT